MPNNASRFVLCCQQTFACAVVAAVGLSAVSVVELQIVAPNGDAQPQPYDAGSTSLVSSAPVEPTVRSVPLVGGGSVRGRLQHKSGTAAADAREIRVVSEPEPVTGYATVGITWAEGQEVGEEEVLVDVRTFDGGTWSDWQEMRYDPDHQPDPGAEGTGVRDGTDAVVVGEVEDVQVRVTATSGVVPGRMAVAIVDPGTDLSPVEQVPAIDTVGAATLDATPPYSGGDASLSANGMPTSPRPKIFSRAQWGADERLRDPGSLRYGKITAGFVHHTVNANDYTKEQVPSILRGIYAYHTRSRGWSDIGYNFLVDRFGQIWEGRYGGVDRPVIGAHTLGYNEETFAMSAIGNFDLAQPSAAMIAAYGKLFAWKLSLDGIAADDARQWVDDRYFPAINGHRDADSTACPGRNLYAHLAEIREQATAIQEAGGEEPEPEPTEPPQQLRPGAPLDASISGADWPDLVLRDAATQRAVVVRTRGQLAFGAGRTGATGWRDVDLVASAGDLDGDGTGDVVARRAGSGAAVLYTGAGDGTFAAGTKVYPRLSRVDQLTGVGDFDGDGHNDLVGRRSSDSALLLYQGRGDGSLARPVQLSPDWRRYDLTEGVDDLDGDGNADLVARSGATLFLVPGTGTGVGPAVALPGAWDKFDVVAGRGDATGDRLADLVVRTELGGTTYILAGDGRGGLSAPLGGWTAHAGARWLALGAELIKGRDADLIGLGGATGRLRVFPHLGLYNLGSAIDTGTVLAGVDLLLNVGDWNGDGRGDLMTRESASGDMQLRLGREGGTFAAPVTAGGGWGSVSMVTAVGDVTGDGRPDLMGRVGDDSHRVYPGDGRTGFGTPFVVRSSTMGYSQVNLGRWDGDDITDTAVRRADGTLWLWSSERSTPVQIAGGLRRYDWVRGLGDLDGDDRADLVVRTRRTGALYLLPGRPDGFAPRRLIAGGYGGYDYLG